MSLSNHPVEKKEFDSRRSLAVAASMQVAIDFSANYFLERAQSAIVEKNLFTVALSGGNTPKAIYEKILKLPQAHQLDWSKILFFFGDERSVPPHDDESNYKLAKTHLFDPLKISENQIFRMKAEVDIQTNATSYEKQILEKVPNGQFDLIMLGMGDDGHTASLFPHTEALLVQNKLVVANIVPQKETSRMTLSYNCINQAHHICFFVFGKNKASMVAQVLEGAYQPLEYPSQKIGTDTSKALWILDRDSASQLKALC